MMRYQVFRGEKAQRDSCYTDPCAGKKQYRLKEARQTVNSLLKAGRFRNARIYECGDHWHIARRRD